MRSVGFQTLGIALRVEDTVLRGPPNPGLPWLILDCYITGEEAS